MITELSCPAVSAASTVEVCSHSVCSTLKMPQRSTKGTIDLCQHIRRLCALLCLFTVVLLVRADVEAQTVTATGKVSEIVALSVGPSIHGNVDVDIVSGSTVRMTLSGTRANPTVIRVPLMVRSNTSFKISGIFESTTAQLTQLSVINVRAMGRLVSPEAVNNVEIQEQTELQDLEGPFLVLSGPRVSVGGTLNSSNNALQITLLIRVKPQPTRDWLVHLTFFNH